MLDDLRFRLRILLRRSVAEGDLDDELRFHLERAAEQHIALGLSPPKRAVVLGSRSARWMS